MGLRVRDKWGARLFCFFGIQLEQVGNDLLLVALKVHSIGRLNRAIELGMGLAQVIGHQVGVVELGERIVWVRDAGIKNGLSGLLDHGFF